MSGFNVKVLVQGSGAKKKGADDAVDTTAGYSTSAFSKAEVTVDDQLMVAVSEKGHVVAVYCGEHVIAFDTVRVTEQSRLHYQSLYRQKKHLLPSKLVGVRKKDGASK